MRLLGQFSNNLEVKILPPIDPTKAQQQNPGQYAKDVRALYAKELCLPLVEQVRRKFCQCLQLGHSLFVEQSCLLQGHEHFAALVRAGVRVSWDGRRVFAPSSVIDAAGFANIAPRPGRKKE